MTGKQLKNSILQWAIQGKLVPQDPNDEPASVLLERIRAEKARLAKEGKIKKDKNESIIFRGEDNSYYEKFADGKVVCIDDEIPFDIPNGWEWCRLLSIASVYGGKRIPVGTKLTTSDTGHKYIRVSDMKNSSVKMDDIHFITDDIYQQIKTYTISKDDLYITVAGTIGGVGEIPEALDKANLTENADKIVFSIINKRFFMYLLQSETVQAQVKACTTKVGQPKLAIIRIQDFLLAIPPLPEQQRIVTKIENILPIIDKYSDSQLHLEKLNETITPLLRKSILQEAIQGKLVSQDPSDESASILLERIRKEKLHLIEVGKLKKKDTVDSVIYKGDDNKYYEKVGNRNIDITDIIPFDIPSPWVWCRIGTLFSHNNGKQLNKGNSRGTMMEYITTSNLYWDGFILDNLKRMAFEDHEIERCQAKKGDLLVCEGGDIGRSCIWPYERPIMLQNHIHKLRAYYPLCTEFFYYTFYLYNMIGLIGGKGIGIQGFSSKALHNTLVPLPPIEEQKRIVNQIVVSFQIIK